MASFLTVFNPFVTAAQVGQALVALENAGGQLFQAWSGPLLIAEGGPEAQDAVRAQEGVALVTDSAIADEMIALAPEGARSLIHAWNLSLTPEYQASLNMLNGQANVVSDFFSHGGCGGESLVGAVTETAMSVAGLFGPLPRPAPVIQHTLCHPERRALVGNVGVAILLIDGKDGTEAAFTAAEAAEMLAAVTEGLRRLQEQAPAAAHLVFHPYFWFTKVNNVAPESVPQPFDEKEPTTQEYLASENVWLNAALTEFRAMLVTHVGSGRKGLRDIVSNTPFLFNVDWAYVIVLTKYRIAYPAYAPDLRDVMISYTLWREHRTQIDPLPLIVAHETGHTVEAYDEYKSSSCNVHALCGWSKTENTNCEDSDIQTSPCIMKSGTFVPCEYTRKHFGWGDADSDGVLDPYDVDYVMD